MKVEFCIPVSHCLDHRMDFLSLSFGIFPVFRKMKILSFLQSLKACGESLAECDVLILEFGMGIVAM